MPDIVASRPIDGAPVDTAWGAAVHDAVEGVQSGGPVSVASGSSAYIAGAWVPVTFPRAFTSAPKVTITNTSGSVVLLVSARSITTTGMELGAVRVDGNGSPATAAAHWMAIGPV